MLANVVFNFQNVIEYSEEKKLKSVMSFNNGGRFSPLSPPKTDLNGDPFKCSSCSLHLHSSTTIPNVGNPFSVSLSPGIIMGVGSVTEFLAPYSKCDTYLSFDAG